MSGFKDMMLTIYGVVMGTSTPILKSARRPLFKIRKERVNPELELVFGGSGNQAVLQTPEHWVIINTSQGTSGLGLLADLRAQSEGLPRKPRVTLIVQAETPEFAALLGSWNNFAEVLIPLKSSDQTLRAGGYEIQIRKTKVSNGGELLVEIPLCRLAFMGPLFYSRLHPVLRHPQHIRVAEWIQALRDYAQQHADWRFIPGEGAMTGVSAVLDFADYLETLADPSKEFAYCRKHFDWPEIMGYTSLEENFDILKGAANR